MKVLLPSNINHTITLEPRFYPTSILDLEITKEVTSVKTNQEPTYTILNGVMTLTFDLVGVEFERFTIKLIENNEVVYRCRLFFTEQEPQNYKITKDKFIYA